ELQRADANKSQFLAMLAHELRNPMAPLVNGLALLGMLREPKALADTQAMMSRQIDQLRRLIDDLLDVSRIDRGKLALVRDRVTSSGCSTCSFSLNRVRLPQVVAWDWD